MILFDQVDLVNDNEGLEVKAKQKYFNNNL